MVTIHRRQRRGGIANGDHTHDLDLYIGHIRGPYPRAERINNDLRPSHAEDASITHTYHRHLEGTLLSVCWCAEALVWVTERDVFNGRTQTCAEPDCGPDYDDQAARLRARDRRRGLRRKRRGPAGAGGLTPPNPPPSLLARSL